jgi:alpha-tubulin suppressor-like RCC1 family protein
MEDPLTESEHITHLQMDYNSCILVSNKSRMFYCGWSTSLVANMNYFNCNETLNVKLAPNCDKLPFFGKEMTQFCVGYNHALALTSDGMLYGAGNSKNGKLGFKSDTYHFNKYQHLNHFNHVPVNAINVGDHFSVIQTKDNRIFCYGIETVPNNVQSFSAV